MALRTRSKTASTAPAGIEQARKMARIKAHEAAPIWGLTKSTISLRCRRKEIPEAVMIGKTWYVTPSGMDRFFEKQGNKR
jgi:hypothetical protein